MFWDRTIMETLNLILASLGFGVFAIALAFQLVEWTFSDNLIKVELLAGAASRGGRVVSRKLKSFDEDDLRSQGFQEFLFIVRAKNIGRIAIDIVHWDIFTSKGLDYSLEEFHLNPTLPYHLQPGSVVHFYIPMEHIVAAVYAASVLRGLAKQVCASVTLKTGAERRSKMHRIPSVNL